MIATISPSPTHYQHSLNTLKYADRAKEIKTHVRRNQTTVQEHVSKLRDQIATLQKENADLKAALCQPKVRWMNAWAAGSRGFGLAQDGISTCLHQEGLVVQFPFFDVQLVAWC